MNIYNADIQIHSCLSPCGDIDASPARIAAAAKEKGIDIIAITDHNTADNSYAMAEAIKRTPGLAAFYGTEVTTSEEMHVICLFGSPDGGIRLRLGKVCW